MGIHFWWLVLFSRQSIFPSRQIAIEVTLIKIVSLAVLVYSTNYFLIPHLLYKKKYLLFGMIYLVWIFAIGSLKVYINEKVLTPFFGHPKFFQISKERIYDNIIPLFSFDKHCSSH